MVTKKAKTRRPSATAKRTPDKKTASYKKTSAAVRQEVKMAREMGKPVCQIKPTSSRGSKPVPGAGRQYNWNQKNLKKIFGE